MLDEAKVLQQVFDRCDVPCQASKILPKEILQFTTGTKPDTLGQFFNADVMEEFSQKIIVIRENLTSFTDSLIIKNQTKPALREALIVLTSRLKLGNNLSIRVDIQSSLASLRADKSLESLGIFLIISQLKNVNKNATADTAIRELREQFICLSPQGGAVSETTLARATAVLNSVIRHTGRSAKELWLSRDQLSGVHIQLNDQQISNSLFENQQPSLLPSAKLASIEGKPASLPFLQVGSMVYVEDDCSKSKPRDSYFVLNLDEDTQIATVLKFPTSNLRHLPIHVLSQNLYLCTETVTSEPPQAMPKQAVTVHHATAPGYVTPPRFVLPPTAIYAPYGSDSDDNDHSRRFPMPLFPGSLHQPEVIAEVPLQLPPGGDPVRNQRPVHHLDDADAFLQPNLDLIPILEEIHDQPPFPTLHLNQPLYGQKSYLKCGDTVALVQGDSWCKVILTSHSGYRDARNHSLYWNYSALDGSQLTGGYLFPGQAWGVLSNELVNVDLSSVEIVMPEGYPTTSESDVNVDEEGNVNIDEGGNVNGNE